MQSSGMQFSINWKMLEQWLTFVGDFICENFVNCVEPNSSVVDSNYISLYSIIMIKI